MSSMSSLYIGVSGLNVSQNSLNTTAHNLANVDTKGYVRQQVLTTDFMYYSVGESHNTLNQVGIGTDMSIVRQVRDRFLDKSYRTEIGRQGFYQTQYEALREVEDVFGELEGVAFQDSMEKFWVSLQELSKEPDSIVARASLIQTSVSFIERAENISKQLNAYQLNLNTQIRDKVKRINEIGDEINKLNIEVRNNESAGVEQANDYRDARNSLLDELGQLVKITYKENSAGVVTVNVEGTAFVTESNVFHMDVAPVSDTSDMLKPVWSGYRGDDVYQLDSLYSSNDDTDIGALKGLLIARGTKIANYKDIPIEPKRSDYLEEEDYNIALGQYNADVKTYNENIQPSIIMTVQAQFDQLIHGVATKINDILSPNKEIWIMEDGEPKKIKVFDEANAPVGMDKDKTTGIELFKRKNTERYGDYETVDVLQEDGSIVSMEVRRYNEEDRSDNYSLYTLGEIEVNPDIMSNYSKIPLSSNTGSGDYDIEVCKKLSDAWQAEFATLDPNTLTKNNFSNYYTSFIAGMANRGNVLNTISTNQEDMITSIDNARMNVAGVSSDEELTNLIKFQHAYNASSRYITVVSEMLEHIIMKLA